MNAIKSATIVVTVFIMITMLSLVVLQNKPEIEEEVTPGIPSQITIAKEDTICEIDDDCTTVLTKCGSCECYGKPVNKQFESKYTEELKKICSGQDLLACDMMCYPTNLECKNNKCTLEIMSTAN
jgi:hypothetical protein